MNWAVDARAALRSVAPTLDTPSIDARFADRLCLALELRRQARAGPPARRFIAWHGCTR